MARVPSAGAGQHGDVHTLHVCCRIVRGFALNEEQTLAVLRDWNVRCQPALDESQLRKEFRHALDTDESESVVCVTKRHVRFLWSAAFA